jgi:hypothetical protein
MAEMGERLRRARLAAGYATAGNAARAFGWKPSTYYGHENGDRQISRRAALRYSRAFHVRAGYLLYSEGEAHSHASPQPGIDPAAMTVVVRSLLATLGYAPEIAGNLAQTLTASARTLSGLAEDELTEDRAQTIVNALVGALGRPPRK